MNVANVAPEAIIVCDIWAIAPCGPAPRLRIDKCRSFVADEAESRKTVSGFSTPLKAHQGKRNAHDDAEGPEDEACATCRVR